MYLSPRDCHHLKSPPICVSLCPSVVQDLPCCCSSCLMDRRSSTLETSELIPRWKPTQSYSAAECRRSTWTPRKCPPSHTQWAAGLLWCCTALSLFVVLVCLILEPTATITPQSLVQIFPGGDSGSQCQLSPPCSYCSPEYTFPRQQEVINFAVNTAFELVTLSPRTLVVCGSYSVGKEKVFLGKCVEFMQMLIICPNCAFYVLVRHRPGEACRLGMMYDYRVLQALSRLTIVYRK